MKTPVDEHSDLKVDIHKLRKLSELKYREKRMAAFLKNPVLRQSVGNFIL